VRVIAATHVKLFDAVSKGKFREDLYYRLSTVPIQVPPLRERGNDIDLLFRKFATDFSEKYRVKPIKLDEEATSLLLKYRFPGNIRQLKNISEQISALEIDRSINKSTLNKYLPELPSTLPSLSSSDESDSFSERDLLYKVLFDMKKDMTELKKLVFQLLNDGLGEPNLNGDIIEKHQDLFQGIDNNSSFTDVDSRLLLPGTPVINDEFKKSSPLQDSFQTAEVHEIVHEEEEESLSIENKEKELIIKALDKNRNKRKYAAKDLGISERTLYRKIKQYGIN